MKKEIAILSIFILISTTLISAGVESNPNNNHVDTISPLQKIKTFFFDRILQNRFKKYEFSPEDIELKDDAFHKATNIHNIEWWYFDAIFDNGYSLHMGIRVLNAFTKGIVFSNLNIYNKGKLVAEKHKSYWMSDFSASHEIPFIKINGKQVMEGTIDRISKDWIYDVSLDIDGVSANLHFIGQTQGWKGDSIGGKWAVILPRAEVSGEITINDKTINVKGIGYHDHNWDVTALAGINFGWLWGKFNSKNYTVTWSNIMKTRCSSQPILVINTKNGGYINIEPEDIQFTPENFIFNNGMIIPTSFEISVNNEDYTLHVNMKVLNVHHKRYRGIINYWRYNIRYTGEITFKSQIETIDEMQIAELIRFR